MESKKSNETKNDSNINQPINPLLPNINLNNNNNLLFL